MSEAIPLAERYRAALAQLLRGDNTEAALLDSYDCGRQALAEGWSLLDLATLYFQALLDLRLGALLNKEASSLLTKGEEFLAQSLVPFEVAQRGFAEANVSLRQLNETLAQQVAALRMRDEQLARQAAHLQAIGDATSAFAEAVPDYTRLLQTVCRTTAEAAGAACWVRLLSEDGEYLEPGVAYHHNADIQARVASALTRMGHNPRDGLWGPVMEYGRAVRLDMSLARLPAALSQPEADVFQQLSISAILSAPLAARGRMLGEMSVVRFGAQGAFSADDEMFLRALTSRAALAIDNARLHRDSQEALNRERAARSAVEEAVRMRDEFLSVAAHELKTPVASLRTYVQIMLQRLAHDEKVDQARLERALRGIEGASERVSRLVTQLLDVARIEAGRLRLECHPTDIVRLVRSLADATEQRLTRHTLHCTTPAQAWAVVDALRIEQVLTNLLENAVKYSPSGGTIDIDVQTPDADVLEIRVRDHGSGIPPEKRPRIFERFYQAHSENHSSGMGLGLYISRQIVEQHGGSIDAEFPADGGTRMVVRLPGMATPAGACSASTSVSRRP